MLNKPREVIEHQWFHPPLEAQNNPPSIHCEMYFPYPFHPLESLPPPIKQN